MPDRHLKTSFSSRLSSFKDSGMRYRPVPAVFLSGRAPLLPFLREAAAGAPKGDRNEQ